MSKFVERYLRTVFRTIKRAKLVRNGDVVFVALSGGKDSASALYTIKKYVEENSIDCTIKGFHINLGLPISKKVENTVKRQTKLVDVELVIADTNKLGISILDIAKKSRRPICSCCGIIKRYLMNKIPRELGANKLATGHHMDDFLVFFFKNVLGQNFFWISKFRPFLKSTHPKMLCRIRPLFEVGGKENRMFCNAVGMPFLKENFCPYTNSKYHVDMKREKWYETIYSIESWQKNFRRQMIRSIEKMSKYFEREEEVKTCKICGEPTNQEVCGFCKLVKLANL